MALGAEVGRGCDEAGAEEDLPEAVCLDASGERMFAHRHPLGQAEAIGWRVDAQMMAAESGYTNQSLVLWGPGGVPVALGRQSMVVFG